MLEKISFFNAEISLLLSDLSGVVGAEDTGIVIGCLAILILVLDFSIRLSAIELEISFSAIVDIILGLFDSIVGDSIFWSREGLLMELEISE